MRSWTDNTWCIVIYILLALGVGLTYLWSHA